MEETIGVLARVTAAGLVAEIASTAFRKMEEGWRQIDSGLGDRYRHAQGNYLPGGLCNENAALRWMTAPAAQHPGREALVQYPWAGEVWGVYLRTPEELSTDPVPEEQPGSEGIEVRVTRLEQQAGEMEQMLDMILEGVTQEDEAL